MHIRLTFSALLLLVGLNSPVLGATEPKCTQEPESKWMDANEFQQHLKEHGYRIKTFKITDGNCYEIYGWNKEGQRVEIYFNPVDGNVVKSRKE